MFWKKEKDRNRLEDIYYLLTLFEIKLNRIKDNQYEQTQYLDQKLTAELDEIRKILRNDIHILANNIAALQLEIRRLTHKKEEKNVTRQKNKKHF